MQNNGYIQLSNFLNRRYLQNFLLKKLILGKIQVKYF
jgi:hypothetical protein